VGSNPPEDDHETWISVFIGDEHGPGDQYLYALYFTLTTMTTVGYGDMSPKNISEIRFVLFLLLVASVVFAGLMGALTDLVFNLNNESNLRQERKAMLSRYMRWRAVPRKLFLSVREHLLFLWETNVSFDEYEGAIKEQLSPVLKKELSYHIYGRILRAAPFLAWMRGCEICLKELAQVVQSMFLAKGDYLFHVGQPNEHIYVFLKGTMYISQNEKLNIAPENKKHKDKDDQHANGMTDFTIPRNKEANALDVLKEFYTTMSKNAKKKQLAKEEAKQMEEAKMKRSMSTMDLLGGKSLTDMKREEEAEKQNRGRPALSRKMTGILQEANQDLLETHIDSSVLHIAFKKLHRQDERDRKAACFIQRRWRRNHSHRALTVGAKGLNTARSKFVHAPAYLGESCLWDPLDEWEYPGKAYPYAARCDTRGEFVYMGRGDLKEIIDRFSPWLATRFEYFRLSVVDNIRIAEMGCPARQMSPSDTPALPSEACGEAEALPIASPDGGSAAHHHNHQHHEDHGTSNHTHDMVTRDLPHVCEGEAINHPRKYGGGNVLATPLSVAIEQRIGGHHRVGGTSTKRSFKAAAAAAIARVASRVTPPDDHGATPLATPRLHSARGARPSSARGERPPSARGERPPSARGGHRAPTRGEHVLWRSPAHAQAQGSSSSGQLCTPLLQPSDGQC